MQKPKRDLKLVVKVPDKNLSKEQIDNILYYIYGIKDTDYTYEYKVGRPLIRDRHIHKVKINITFNMPKDIMVGVGI